MKRDAGVTRESEERRQCRKPRQVSPRAQRLRAARSTREPDSSLFCRRGDP
jgi:hypothetical protein